MLLLLLIAGAKFSAYKDNPELTAMLETMPPALLDAFGMRAFNLTTLQGFFGVMSIYFNLMGALAGALWGAGILSKEEEGRTADFLLALPIERERVVLAKALAVGVTCGLFVFITWLASLGVAGYYRADAAFYPFLGLEMVSMLLITWTFAAVAFFFSGVLRPASRATSLSVALVLAFYVLSVISEMHDRLKFLKYITPFKYFDAATLAREGRLNSLHVLLFLTLSLVGLVSTIFTYRRRDIYL